MGVGVVAPACSRQRPGMLLNILQGTGQPPHNKEPSAQNVGSAEVEKSWSREMEACKSRLLFPPCSQLQGLDGGL